MHDLLIKGGRLIDPAQDMDEVEDIAVDGKRIALVAKGIPAAEGRRLIDATGKIVTPGLIDLHTHVYNDVFKYALEPDIAGVRQGVTTVVDGGSAGESIFSAFPRYVIPSARTSVYVFLHLGSQGESVMPEFRDWTEIDLDATSAVVESYPGLIKGIKMRLVGNVMATAGVQVIEMAQKTAKKFGLPIMVHIGDMDKQVGPTLTQDLLRLMEKGDIVTHMYTPNYGGLVGPDGNFVPELEDARKRGVVLDAAMGKYNFSYAVARKGISEGVLPDTISTDVTKMSINGPVYGLTVTMSKFLALGLDLRQVVQMTTVNAARAISIEHEKGTLKPGMDADISVLDIASGSWEMEDTSNDLLRLERLITPVMSVKAGQVIPAEPVSRPKLL